MTQVVHGSNKIQAELKHKVEVDAAVCATDATNATDLICGEELPHTANEPQEYGQQNEAYILKS